MSDLIAAANAATAVSKPVYAGPGSDTWSDGTILVEALDGTNGHLAYGGDCTVSYSADVNGDGFADTIQSDITYNNWRGRAWVVFGTAQGAPNLAPEALDGTNGFVITTNIDFEALSFVGITDHNRDGYVDLVVTTQGQWHIVYGHSSLPTAGDATDNVLRGANGDDLLEGFDGADVLRGGDRNDRLEGGADDDVLNGGRDDDTMLGGTGNDTYRVDSAGDIVSEAANEGTDSVISTVVDNTLGDNVENLRLLGTALNGTGNALDNTIVGNGRANTLLGLDGADTLTGFGGHDTLDGGAQGDTLSGDGGKDTLDGGDGDDVLLGGTAFDTLTGGAGADVFRFLSSDAGADGNVRDIITDFNGIDGDTIDLSQFDANSGVSGTQAFLYVHGAAFTGTAGELRSSYDSATNVTWLEGDIDGDGSADLLIRLSGEVYFGIDDLTGVIMPVV